MPPETRGEFTVRHRGLLFAGDLGSYIDRQVYLNGWYEEDDIDLFLSRAPNDRRGVILDVGANVGTHSLRFAKAFAHVHAFDPNARVWEQFERNIVLNGLSNVTLHKLGLGREAALTPLYSIENGNGGLGTFSTDDLYDQRLAQIGVASVVNGDQYLSSLGVDRVDAIKIDTQGFESEVLAGLLPVLKRDRPIVWVEAGLTGSAALRTEEGLRAHFPYPVEISRFVADGAPFFDGRAIQGLKPESEGALPSADYIIEAA